MQVEDLGPRPEDYYEQHEKPEAWRKQPQGPAGEQPIPGKPGYAAKLKKLLKKLRSRKS